MAFKPSRLYSRGTADPALTHAHASALALNHNSCQPQSHSCFGPMSCDRPHRKRRSSPLCQTMLCMHIAACTCLSHWRFMQVSAGWRSNGKKFESVSASMHGLAMGILQPLAVPMLGMLPLSRTVDILHKYGFSLPACSDLKGSQKAPPQRPCCAAIAHIGQSLRQAAPGQVLRS